MTPAKRRKCSARRRMHKSPESAGAFDPGEKGEFTMKMLLSLLLVLGMVFCLSSYSWLAQSPKPREASENGADVQSVPEFPAPASAPVSPTAVPAPASAPVSPTAVPAPASAPVSPTAVPASGSAPAADPTSQPELRSQAEPAPTSAQTPQPLQPYVPAAVPTSQPSPAPPADTGSEPTPGYEPSPPDYGSAGENQLPEIPT